MTRTPLLLILAASAALAGCNKESHTIVAGPDGEDNAAPVNVANVQLPPSITSSKIYRCKDNSVIYVDWLSDGQPIQGSADAGVITYKGQSCNS